VFAAQVTFCMSGLSALPLLRRQSPSLATRASAFTVEVGLAEAGVDAAVGVVDLPGAGPAPSSPRVRNTAAAAAPPIASSTTTMITPIAVPERPCRTGACGGPQTSPDTEFGVWSGRAYAGPPGCASVSGSG
jgi:hypothetical protein